VDAFSSNDPLPPGPLPYAEITNPQSLNKYAYTYNNPLRYTDPNGHTTCPPVCTGVEVTTTLRLVRKGAAAAAAGTAVAGATIVGGGLLALYSSMDLYFEERYSTMVFAQISKENAQRVHEQQQQEEQAQAEPETSADGANSRKGGGRNERKANIKRVEAAKKEEQAARTELQRLKSLPVNQRPPNYKELVDKAQGRLNRAIDKQRKSPQHSQKRKT